METKENIVTQISHEVKPEFLSLKFNKILSILNEHFSSYEETKKLNTFSNDIELFNYLYTTYLILKNEKKLNELIQIDSNNTHNLDKYNEIISSTKFSDFTIEEIKNFSKIFHNFKINESTFIDSNYEIKNTQIISYELAQKSDNNEKMLYKDFNLNLKITNLEEIEKILFKRIKEIKKNIAKQNMEEYDDEDLEEKIKDIENSDLNYSTEELRFFLGTLIDEVFNEYLMSKELYEVIQNILFETLIENIYKYDSQYKNNNVKIIKNLQEQFISIQNISLNLNIEEERKLEGAFNYINNYNNENRLTIKELKTRCNNMKKFYNFPLKIDTSFDEDNLKIIHINDDFKYKDIKLNIKFSMNSYKDIDKILNRFVIYDINSLKNWKTINDIFDICLIYSDNPIENILNIFNIYIEENNKVINIETKKEKMLKIIENIKSSKVYSSAFKTNNNNFSYNLYSMILSKNFSKDISSKVASKNVFIHIKNKKELINVNFNSNDEHRCFKNEINKIKFEELIEITTIERNKDNHSIKEYLYLNIPLTINFNNDIEFVEKQENENTFEVNEIKHKNGTEINRIYKLKFYENIQELKNIKNFNNSKKMIFFKNDLENYKEDLFIFNFFSLIVDYNFLNNNFINKKLYFNNIFDVSFFNNEDNLHHINENERSEFFKNIKNSIEVRNHTLNDFKNLKSKMFLEEKEIDINKINKLNFGKYYEILKNNENFNLENTLIINITSFICDNYIKNTNNKLKSNNNNNEMIYGDIYLFENKENNILIEKIKDFIYILEKTQINLIEFIKELIELKNIKNIIYLAHLNENFSFNLIDNEKNIIGMEYLNSFKKNLNIDSFYPLIFNTKSVYTLNENLKQNIKKKEMVISNNSKLKNVSIKALYPIASIISFEQSIQKELNSSYKDHLNNSAKDMHCYNILDINSGIDINEKRDNLKKEIFCSALIGNKMFEHQHKKLTTIFLYFNSILNSINDYNFSRNELKFFNKNEHIYKYSNEYIKKKYLNIYHNGKIKINLLSFNNNIISILNSIEKEEKNDK
jgi:hypothetical protein